MINWESILSVFNEKGTLLKFLQKVEAALKNDSLTGVDVTQPTTTTATLKFNFKDGSSITSDTLTLAAGATGATGPEGPQGPAGPKGSQITAINTGSPIPANDYTQTLVTVNMSNPDDTKYFTISTKNGEKGEKGNGIISVTTLGSTQGTGEYEGYTVTSLNVDTDEETIPITVYAKNGAQGRGITAVASGQPTTNPANPGYTITPVTAQFTDGSGNTFNVFAKDGEPERLFEYGVYVKDITTGLFNMTFIGRPDIDISRIEPFDLVTSFIENNTSEHPYPVTGIGRDKDTIGYPAVGVYQADSDNLTFICGTTGLTIKEVAYSRDYVNTYARLLKREIE